MYIFIYLQNIILYYMDMPSVQPSNPPEIPEFMTSHLPFHDLNKSNKPMGDPGSNRHYVQS